jgi:putative ATP-binding cassette transporter
MKIIRYIFTLTITLSVLFTCVQNAYASDSDKIENLIQNYKHDSKCNSVSVIVIEDETVSFYGDSESLYQIGSMTKAFTGLAVQKLIAEGKVDEDAVISDYIPGFESYYNSAKVDITVRNLLEQKSGYTNKEKDYPSASEDMTLTDWADSISGLELKSMPGTEYAYSNVNYNLLGLIIENVSNMTYRDYMEEEILAPLGLENTRVGTFSDKNIIEGSRLGYRHAYDYSIAVKEACIPAGYYYSNSEDMGRWIKIWTGSEDISDDLREPLIKTKNYLTEEGDYYSGWELFSDGVIGHSGGTANYSSRIVFDENTKTGVCVLSNLNVAATTDSLCNSIFDIVSGKEACGLTEDIWTIFDKIFSLLTLIAVLLLIPAIKSRSRCFFLTVDVILTIVLILIFILFPIIFGADMKEILFKWAPWSLTGGLLSLACVVAVISVKLLMVKKYGDNNKTGKRQAA